MSQSLIDWLREVACFIGPMLVLFALWCWI